MYDHQIVLDPKKEHPWVMAAVCAAKACELGEQADMVRLRAAVDLMLNRGNSVLMQAMLTASGAIASGPEAVKELQMLLLDFSKAELARLEMQKGSKR